MIAKLVVHADDRAQSLATLARSLDQTSVLGLTTNKGFLARLLRHPKVVQGALSTSLIADELPQLAEPADTRRDELAAIAASLTAFARRRAADDFLPGVVTGFRNNRFRDQRDVWRCQARELAVSYRDLGGGEFLAGLGAATGRWKLAAFDAPALTLEGPDGVRHKLRLATADDAVFVHTPFGPVTLHEVPRFPRAQDAAVKGGFMAPMPGKVVKVMVADGEAVKRGQALLVLEAMKMEQMTSSPTDGVVKRVLVREGEQVTAGQVLVVMEA
jgi:acetyl/propionyl-CoA carboxylase alpha subunit